ncbi:hypothetical protein [Brevibacillus laterosporus]|uniref:Lipoprotein n=1 Tax=Brevibacillus laterosporus TaxID=1465 RepID=A0AAP3DLU4_BRELA|nr:hypothetical protein [Brevibacillus laterosporus]MCR8983347.1 hypothetical protein [Brevibacillus laterosporus]MCZ0810503.1 hypothetical protein [Brevibacillus laterosporus]MCZ0829069.1 hypothetical protein [Brevibacillus laterosporus]MCZ0853237.1 hypothetical protein [Brevibacillus laterosporus]PPA90282.1 hypothetical protein C4A77_24655 [Brevibacillus laterosporus]
MKKMKGTLLVLLACAMLTACSNNSGEKAQVNPEGTPAPAAVDTKANNDFKGEPIKDSKGLPDPSQINVYNYGNKKTLKSTDADFKKIVELTNKRMGIVGEIVPTQETELSIEKATKLGLAIEYVYDQPVEHQIVAKEKQGDKKVNTTVKVTSKSDIFIFSGNESDRMYYSEDGKTYTDKPIRLTETKELTKLISK